jgi:hypothetical protein
MIFSRPHRESQRESKSRGFAFLASEVIVYQSSSSLLVAVKKKLPRR